MTQSKTNVLTTESSKTATRYVTDFINGNKAFER